MTDKNRNGLPVVSAFCPRVDQSGPVEQPVLELHHHVRRWVRRVSRRVYPPTYVLGRVACLGQDVFNLLPACLSGREQMLPTRRCALMNMQKVRCDALLEWAHANDHRTLKTRAAAVIPHLERKDVAWLIEQQERMIWFDSLPYAYAVMDSFAELTDQRFRHRREGWTFSCHFTDLKPTPEFTAEFECLGLLPVEWMRGVYGAFFEWFARVHPDKPLFFLHFPAVHDNRAMFKQRAAAILEAVTALQRELRADYLYSLALPDEQVVKAPGDDFAYHFGPETFARFAGLWEATYAAR
jgi:hypothetical protein